MTVYLPSVGVADPVAAGPGNSGWFWLAWVVAFVVLELGLYVRRGTDGTFSAVIWRWLDAGPGGERYRRARWALLAGSLFVLAWHFLAGAW